jgi:hypothetical protein
VSAGDELALALEELPVEIKEMPDECLPDHGLRAAVALLAGRVPVPVEIKEMPDECLPERPSRRPRT